MDYLKNGMVEFGAILLMVEKPLNGWKNFIIIALIFARTETIGFHERIWNKADGVFFFKGRLKFYRVDGTEGDCANAPSCLIAYGEENSRALKNCNLKGKYINLFKFFLEERNEKTT